MRRVERMIEDELSVRDRTLDDEPEAAFTVRVPVTQMAHLEQMASYLGQKKTRFAAGLLIAALDDAFDKLIEAEEERGNSERLREHFEGRWTLEDGSGWVEHGSNAVDTAKLVKQFRERRNGKAE